MGFIVRPIKESKMQKLIGYISTKDLTAFDRGEIGAVVVLPQCGIFSVEAICQEYTRVEIAVLEDN
jgi:hypothetical protein